MTAERSYGYTTPPAGFRLPEEVRLGEVRLQVSDLSRSIAYYQRVVGLRVLEKTETRATLGIEGTALVELNQKAGVKPVPRRGLLGLYHFAILLPNREALGSFIAHLASLGEYAGMADHFVSEAVYLTDPDGLGIEVYADRARASWATTGAILNMGSVHLDAEDLIRAAKGKRWEGAPEGTKIGHVHLYVNDIAVAEKFYHNAVGLDKVNLEFPGALFMSAGGYHHHLGTNTWAAAAPQATDDDARLLEWTVDLPSRHSLGRLSESLAGNGYPVESGPDSITTIDPWTTRVTFRSKTD
jgi:catechol 2,3-dioxygenase